MPSLLVRNYRSRALKDLPTIEGNLCQNSVISTLTSCQALPTWTYIQQKKSYSIRFIEHVPRINVFLIIFGVSCKTVSFTKLACVFSTKFQKHLTVYLGFIGNIWLKILGLQSIVDQVVRTTWSLQGFWAEPVSAEKFTKKI